MKLLFDQNLSPALVFRLTDLFPGSDHVASLELDRGLGKGNCSTDSIESLLRGHSKQINDLAGNDVVRLLMLF